MGFKVGQKVVCVQNFTGTCGIPLIKGEIYTCVKIKDYPEGQSISVDKLGPKWDTWAYRFRPLDYDFVEEVIKQVTPKEQEA